MEGRGGGGGGGGSGVSCSNVQVATKPTFLIWDVGVSVVLQQSESRVHQCPLGGQVQRRLPVLVLCVHLLRFGEEHLQNVGVADGVVESGILLEVGNIGVSLVVDKHLHTPLEVLPCRELQSCPALGVLVVQGHAVAMALVR